MYLELSLPGGPVTVELNDFLLARPEHCPLGACAPDKCPGICVITVYEPREPTRFDVLLLGSVNYYEEASFMHLPFDWMMTPEHDGGLTIAHIIPIGDLIDHDSHPDCICGPDDCVFSWQHHSLDGREFTEPPFVEE